jgi:ankyrin repeat protein
MQDSRLYDAARSGRMSELKKLMEEHNLDINCIDFNTGNTALHAAVQYSQIQMIEYLISKGADCNIKNRRGQTPLHLSIENRFVVLL